MSITELVSGLHLKDSVTLTLNTQFLNHNFQIVKECLLRIKDIESNLGKSKQNTSNIESKLKEMEGKITQNSNNISSNSEKLKEITNNVGDEFMKKMYAIQEKTQNMYDFDETVRRLQGLDKFVLQEQFKDHQKEIQQDIQNVWKLKQQFERYVPQSYFNDYKNEQQALFAEKQQSIDKANEEIKILEEKIKQFSVKVETLSDEIKQNNEMIKDINFADMLEKIKKQKDEVDRKVSEFAIKLKKKVGANDLLAFEKSMIQKLDHFFSDNEILKAEKNETRDALLFLQKKINELAEVILKKLPDEEKDALFTSKKWQCASCTKDLGKFEGKLGQFKPWSIFPCKEPDPEKSGGFGYLNYIDKMAYRRGYDMEDQNLQRLSKTFNDSKQTPRKMNSTRASNLISNYGSEQRRSSLKDHYFREAATERGERALNTSKNFRVKKDHAKPVDQEGKNSESLPHESKIAEKK